MDPMSKGKRRTLTLKDKVKIIKEIERSGTQAPVVKRGVAPSSVVSRVWKNKEKILQAHATRPKNTRKIKDSTYKMLDDKLFLWFKEMRLANIPISTS